MTQLAFDLPHRPALGREDYLVSQVNAPVLALLDAPERWPAGKLVLTGPEGAGKSHLAQVFAHDRGAAVVASETLAAADLPGLARGPVVVEDADRLPETGEAALFHLHNLLAGRAPLLLTARAAPRDWPTRLPDLRSRMEAATVATLAPPDDALLGGLLVKLFADRQIAVPPTLIPWLVARMERSFEGARGLVAALDARALAQGRAVTRGLAQEVLDGRV